MGGERARIGNYQRRIAGQLGNYQRRIAGNTTLCTDSEGY